MDYEKPRQKPGQVCYSCRWDRNGRLREALYRPISKPNLTEPEAHPTTALRGALAAEAQGRLL